MTSRKHYGKNLQEQRGSLRHDSPGSMGSSGSKGSKNTENTGKQPNREKPGQPGESVDLWAKSQEIIQRCLAESKQRSKTDAGPKPPMPAAPVASIGVRSKASTGKRLDWQGRPFDPLTGTLEDGKAYLQLVQWFTSGGKFTQTAWNRKIRIEGDRRKLEFLYRTLRQNIDFIENGMLVDIRLDKNTLGHTLVTIRDGKLVFISDDIWRWHAEKKADAGPILQILKKQNES